MAILSNGQVALSRSTDTRVKFIPHANEDVASEPELQKCWPRKDYVGAINLTNAGGEEAKVIGDPGARGNKILTFHGVRIKFVGKWWLIRVTERVFNNDEDCAHFVVSKKNGNTYDVLVQFHKTKTDSVRKMDFDITDRTDQPAIYDLLVKGKPIVTAQILGTDYDNWAVIYIAEGTYMIYTVASRTPKLDPQFSSKIEAIMSENGATTTFEEVNGACADTI